MWELLDDTGKEGARAVMKTVDLPARLKDTKGSKVVVTERAAVMGLGENGYMAYRLGAYCPVFLFRTTPLA